MKDHYLTVSFVWFSLFHFVSPICVGLVILIRLRSSTPMLKTQHTFLPFRGNLECLVCIHIGHHDEMRQSQIFLSRHTGQSIEVISWELADERTVYLPCNRGASVSAHWLQCADTRMNVRHRKLKELSSAVYHESSSTRVLQNWVYLHSPWTGV